MTSRTPVCPTSSSACPRSAVTDVPAQVTFWPQPTITERDSDHSNPMDSGSSDRVASSIRGMLGPAGTNPRRPPTAPPTYAVPTLATPMHHPTPSCLFMESVHRSRRCLHPKTSSTHIHLKDRRLETLGLPHNPSIYRGPNSSLRQCRHRFFVGCHRHHHLCLSTITPLHHHPYHQHHCYHFRHTWECHNNRWFITIKCRLTTRGQR
jgi:hypothetical protein